MEQMASASYSRIQTYKSCRRLYELKYVYGVKSTEKIDALERGTSYHEKVEKILKGDDFEIDDPKTSAMAMAFKEYILPQLQPVAQEEWFKYKTEFGDEFIGRVDALNADGAIIEHKTTSGDIDEEYWYSRDIDEQLMTYMYAYGTRKAYYTVCKTPTIRLKKDETDESFYRRCLDWFNEDTESKIAMRVIYHTDEEINAFIAEQALTIKEMKECKLFYKNQSYCTKWNRMCEYAPICQHYDPTQTYVGFEKREEKKDETDNNGLVLLQ